jgi:hypothetical protein
MRDEDASDRSGESGRYRHEFGPEKPYTVAIVEAVSEATDAPPSSLPELLYEAVDADALEALLRHGESNGEIQPQVSFQFCDCLVTLSPDRTVLVGDPPEV